MSGKPFSQEKGFSVGLLVERMVINLISLPPMCCSNRLADMGVSVLMEEFNDSLVDLGDALRSCKNHSSNELEE